MKRNLFILFSLSAITCIVFAECSKKNIAQKSESNSDKGLKDYYKDYFTMGAAVSPQGLKREEEARLIIKEFGSMTPENAMKMGPIHPKENEYFWKDADSIVAFARANHLKLRGHCLCWHSQTPRWLFIDSTHTPPDTVSKELLLKRLKEHITAVVTRYKDVVYAWDVVNEVISDNPNEYFRNSAWYKICGEDFVARAFEYAHEADPKAVLFYNDYNETNPVKREKIIKMVKGLQAKGIPINGVGLQSHWSIHDLRNGQVDSTLSDFAKLGLKLQVTELDMKVQPSGNNTTNRDTAKNYTKEREDLQTEKYAMIFDLFRKYKNNISAVTFWNVSDKYSWLDRRGGGGKAYPLLFDTTYQRKKAYWGVVNFDEKKDPDSHRDKKAF
jgi:endo-1,4-beta-xylanase